jgi:hypothetical protein
MAHNSRFSVQQNDPLLVALLRYSIAFACLVPLLRNTSRWPTCRDWGHRSWAGRNRGRRLPVAHDSQHAVYDRIAER